MNKRLIIILTLTLFFLIGCAGNPYKELYSANPGWEKPRSHPAYHADYGQFNVYLTNNLEDDTLNMMAHNYWPVGYSFFNAPESAIGQSNLKAQASELGAHAVVVQSQHSHTVYTSTPLTVPRSATTTTYSSAAAHGTRGSATAYGTSTATTTWTETRDVRRAIRRNDVWAVFFVKIHHRLGVAVNPLTSEERRELERNIGLRITVVAEGTPAFLADIFAGDILMAIEGEDFYLALSSTPPWIDTRGKLFWYSC